MKIKSYPIIILLWIAPLLIVSPPSFAAIKESIANNITNMVADLSCDNNDQCHSIGFGDKACGGFQSYIVYSTKTVDDKSLASLVKSYNALDREENLKNNMVSTCDILIQPSVSCIQSQCTSVPDNANIH
jgi:hypothetical protein